MIIYDIEIKLAIQGREERRVGIEYCSGWSDFANMGVSCVCAYDYDNDRFRVFMDDNMEEFKELADSSDLIIGYNNIRFDNEVLFKSGIFGMDTYYNNKSYDILREIWLSEGLGPDYVHPTHAGYGLDAVVKANFTNRGKTGWGGKAPVDFQQGKFGSLIDYCIADVWLTKMLFNMILDNEPIVSPVGDTHTVLLPNPLGLEEGET